MTGSEWYSELQFNQVVNEREVAFVKSSGEIDGVSDTVEILHIIVART